MKLWKLIKIESKNFLKSSFFSFIFLVALLMILYRAIGDIPNAMSDKNILYFYFFTTLISSSYATAFLFLINIDRDKMNNVYHRYFVLPVKPHILFAIKLSAPVFSSLLISLIFSILSYQKFSMLNTHLIILSILDTFIFIIGIYFVFFSLELMMKNLTSVAVVRFLLIYLFSYTPSYLLRKGISINTLIYTLVIFSILVFVVGIYLISHIDPEKVVLS